MGIDAEVDTSQGGDIIQTLKDEIYCSICCAIFEVRIYSLNFWSSPNLKDPMKLDCCDGHLCKVCFEDVRVKFPSCPLCRGLSVLCRITLTHSGTVAGVKPRQTGSIGANRQTAHLPSMRPHRTWLYLTTPDRLHIHHGWYVLIQCANKMGELIEPI